MPAPFSDLSDRSLLIRLRGGEQDAATQLYFRYAPRLRALVRARCSANLAARLEPDDVVQSVFRRFFRRVVQGGYEVPPGEELWGLLLVIALNRLRSEETAQRAGKRDFHRVSEAASQNLQQLPADDLAHLEVTVEDVLLRLPQSHRQLIELRIQGHDVAEVARLAGRSKRTVERILQDARARLRELLEVE